jgi:hypothetical protein
MSSLARWQNFSCSNCDRLAWLIDFSLTMLGCTTMIPIPEFPFLKMAQNAYPGRSYSSILRFPFQTRQIALKFIKLGASRLTLYYRRNPVTILLVTCNHRLTPSREDSRIARGGNPWFQRRSPLFSRNPQSGTDQHRS